MGPFRRLPCRTLTASRVLGSRKTRSLTRHHPRLPCQTDTQTPMWSGLSENAAGSHSVRSPQARGGQSYSAAGFPRMHTYSRSVYVIRCNFGASLALSLMLSSSYRPAAPDARQHFFSRTPDASFRLAQARQLKKKSRFRFAEWSHVHCRQPGQAESLVFVAGNAG